MNMTRHAAIYPGFENPAIAADAVRAHALVPARTLALEDFFSHRFNIPLLFRAFTHGPPDPTSSIIVSIEA